MKFRHLWIFPLANGITILPALLMGKPLGDILGVYLGQTVEYNDRLTLNAPSLYALIPYGKAVDVPFWARAGIIAAFAVVAGLLLWLFFFRRRLDEGHILTAALIFAVAVPLILPHMHDRYFFLADTLAVVWAAGGVRRRLPIPAAVQVASLGGYHAYLVLRYAFPMAWGAQLLIASLLALIGYQAYALWRQRHP